MAKKQGPNKWRSEWDIRFKELLRTGVIDINNIKKDNLEKIRKQYFPSYAYNLFQQKVKRAANKVRVEQEISGHRKRQGKLVCMSRNAPLCSSCLSQISNPHLVLLVTLLQLRLTAELATGDNNPVDNEDAEVPTTPDKDEDEQAAADEDSGVEDDIAGGISADRKKAGTRAATTSIDEDNEEVDKLQFSKLQIGDNNQDEMLLCSNSFIIHEFADERTNQSFANIDVFVPALPAEYFGACIGKKDTSILEITVTTLLSVFSSKRLTSTGVPNRLAKGHSRVKSLMEAGQKVRLKAEKEGRLGVSGIVSTPLLIQLPFHVERDLVSTKVHVYNHDDEQMQTLGQGLFLFSVVVENVVKPRKVKPRSTLLTFISTPLKGDSDSSGDEDERQASEATKNSWDGGRSRQTQQTRTATHNAARASRVNVDDTNDEDLSVS